jgi:hypothetical protein
MSYDDLQRSQDVPVEEVTVVGRTGTIATYIEVRPDGPIRVVVQGMLQGRYMKMVSAVSLDGFYNIPMELCRRCRTRSFGNSTSHQNRMEERR